MTSEEWFAAAAIALVLFVLLVVTAPSGMNLNLSALS
jgi:hypothetical protein